MIPVSKKIVLVQAASFLAIALVILVSVQVAQAQMNTAIESTANFSIPTLNGNINFDLNGTYSRASLENGTWTFTNLQANNSLVPLELRVSVQGCNITISSCRTYNATIAIAVNLRYVSNGPGIQAFKLSPLQSGGEWGVTFNGSFIGENEGWNLSRDGTLIVTRAPAGSNVTLTYFFFPDLLGGNGNNSSLTFYQRHSVIIGTGVAVAITLGAVVVVTLVSKRNQQYRLAKKNKNNQVKLNGN